MQHFSIREVAEQLGVADNTIRKEIRKGKLVAVRIGKVYRIAKAALDEYVSAATYRPEPQLGSETSHNARPSMARTRRYFPAKKA